MQLFKRFIPVLCASLWASLALAQSFPTKPIQIFTTDAGAAADILARVQAQALTEAFGMSAVVQNRPGNAIIPVTQVAKAAPDGHTLLSLGGNFFWLQPFLSSDVPYDPVADFAPVTLTARSPNLLIVSNNLPVNSLKELIAYAKSKPGELNFGHGGNGSANHLAVELLKSAAGINVVSVGYKGAAPAMTSLLAGDIHGFFPGIALAMPQIKAGKVKVLGVTSEKPTELAPGIPTISASGLPGFTSGADYVVFVPAKTPNAVIDRLNKVIVGYMTAPDVRKRLVSQGMDVAGSTPAELAAYMKFDRERMGKLIREQGIKN